MLRAPRPEITFLSALLRVSNPHAFFLELERKYRLAQSLSHFDNSPANKFNPDPAKEVRWGEQTCEEMMIGWLSYYIDSPQPAKGVAGSSNEKLEVMERS